MVRAGARLLAARLRRGWTSALVVLVVMATAGAAGASAVLLRSAVTAPWDRAFEATNGAHVHVIGFGDLDAAALAGLPGVAESSGPVVAQIRRLRHGGDTVGVALSGVAPDLRVDRPAVVEGSWPPGALVLERSFATALGVDAGDRVEVEGTSGWRTFEVGGIAVSVRTPGYPATVPGSAFTDPAAAAELGTADRRHTTVGLRLLPGADEEAVARAASRYGMVTTASSIRTDALDRTRQFQVVLTSFSILLLVAAGLLVVVLVGSRLRSQSRELDLLRLIGLTPGQLVGLVAAEHAVLAATGGVIGVAVAMAGGRRLAAAAATSLGSTAPRLDLSVLGVVAVMVAGAATVSALVSRHPARSTSTRPSGATARALAAGLPAPVALVAKEVSSSRARATSTVVAVALAVMTAVAALGMEATFRQERRQAVSASVGAPAPAEVAAADDESGLRTLVYGLQALLGLVAVTSIVAVGLVGLRERRRELAVLNAVGFSARQLAGASVAGQGVLAGLGALVGIPLGIGFFRLAYALANGSAAGLVDAPPLHLAAVVPAAMLMAALVAALPANTLRHLPVAAALAPT
jgi:putative ABC transport system permease protein